MSTRGQKDQKAQATWTFWNWMRMPLFPLRWLYSYFWRGESNENKNTDACPRNEAIQNRTQDTLCHENEKEVFTLKTDNNKLKSRNEELQIRLSSCEQEVINLNRNYSQVRARNRTLETLCQDKEQEVFTLKENYRKLQSRNEELQKHLNSHEEEVIALNSDCSRLRTRLSHIAAMQLTEGNPNIADLSDQNRPDKLAEQFSELYDNQWTDCYQVLTDKLLKTEEDSIKILLEIVKTSYDICLDGSQYILTTTKDILFAFAGRSDEEHDKALDALIQEILHKLKSHRTKSFKAVPTNIEKEIRVKLMSMIGVPETDACDSFIEECIRTCWLMCIKDPPMYIFCKQEAVFDKNKYMEYTEMGDRVAYVVWPALYLHKDGPLMRKGVAQGEGKKYREHTRNANAATSQLPEPDHTQQYYNGIADRTTIDSDHQKKETQAHNSEEMASADDSLGKNDVSSYADKGNADNHGYENYTQTEFIAENGKWKQKQKNEHFPVPSEKNICDSLKQEEMLESTNVLISSDNSGSKENDDANFKYAPKEKKTESIEQSDKLVSSDEYFQARETWGAFNEENQAQETKDRFIECNNSQEVKEATNYVHSSLKKNIGYSSNEAEMEETTLLSNVRSYSNTLEEEEEKNFESSRKGEATQSKEQDDNKLVSTDGYCQQRETLGAGSNNEEENQGKEKHDGFKECNNGQELKEPINLIPASPEKTIGDSTNNAEKEERPQSINVSGSSDDNWKEGKEKCFQFSTIDEEMKSNDQVDNKVFSYDNYSQQMETSGACNINEKENQGNETKDRFIECSNGREVKEAALIVPAPSDKNVYDSLNEVEQEERLKSTNVCSSSDYVCSEDKEEEDVQSSTKDEATESKEQAECKLFLQNEYCQQREPSDSGTINEENQGEQTQDWVILCNDGQEMNEAANIAHQPLEENTCDSSNDTEQERRIKVTNDSSSSDDNKNKDKDNADFHSSP